jgi:intracellular multiplication protein IcmO
LAYYATSGLDRMLAMGRGLNICFMLGFQEVSGIWARLGEKTASLLGNANLTIAMRQQDAGRTREWIEKTAGQTYITQATAYQGAGDGAYREARHAEVRPVSRVDWNDLTSLIEGEAIVLFGGRRIYARVFHAKIDDAGRKRLGRSVVLRAPDPDAVRERLQRSASMAAAIERGALILGDEEDVAPALADLIRGFDKAARSGGSPASCARASLEVLAKLPVDPSVPRPPPPADGTPVTTVSPMLRAANTVPVAGPQAEGPPEEPIDTILLRGLAAIEMAAGTQPADARSAAMAALSERDEAMTRPVRVEPPPMSAEAFRKHLRAVLSELRQLLPSSSVRSAA